MAKVTYSYIKSFSLQFGPRDKSRDRAEGALDPTRCVASVPKATG